MRLDGTTALEVSVPACVSASVASSTIPCAEVVALPGVDATRAVPLALWYARHFQFPDHRLFITMLSPSAVVMLLPAFGNMRLVALCVSVSIQVKVICFIVPACTVQNQVIVVVQVIFPLSPVIVDRSVVVALAISELCAWRIAPVIDPPVKFNLSVSSLASSALMSSTISETILKDTVSPVEKAKAVFVCVSAV